MLQRYKKNRTSASFLLTKCATFLIKCYWGTFSVPSQFECLFFYPYQPNLYANSIKCFVVYLFKIATLVSFRLMLRSYR